MFVEKYAKVYITRYSFASFKWMSQSVLPMLFNSEGISNIISVGTPSKIRHSVIRAYIINVVYLIPVVRICYKSNRYKAMNSKYVLLFPT